MSDFQRGRLTITFALLTIAISFLPCLSAQSPSGINVQGKWEKYASGQLIVRYKPGRRPAASIRLHAMLGSSKKSIFHLLPDVELVQLPAKLPVAVAVQIFGHDPDVLYAQPDYKVYPDDGPNDPMFPLLWGLNNTGLDNGYVGADINALNAWQLTTGSKNVVVGILDTGIDYLHPDLVPNLYRNPDACDPTTDCWGLDVVTDDIYDFVGHGTHTTGTIGAVGNDGLGVTGVNWAVTLLPCKFMTQTGGTDSDAIACMDYMATMKDRGYNIVALNNSWGGGYASQAMYDAIRALADKGILFVAAAGNDGVSNDLTGHYPATYDLPNVISVAASDRTDQMATFSDFGNRTVHISAPGVGIVSTYPPESYEGLSGTSMAAPHVTGVAALLAAYDPTLDWRAIKNRILAGGVNVPTLSGTLTGKRLDAYGALTCTNSNVFGRRTPRNSGVSVAVGGKLKISALNINCGTPAGDVNVDIEPGGTLLTLHDDGKAPDEIAGDGVYSAYFEPQAVGTYTATLSNGDSFTIYALKTYKYSTNTYNYRTVTGTNLNLTDESTATIATPFPIHFGGQTFTTLYVGDNGLISFDHPFDVAPGLALPFFEGGAFVAPWWDDFQPLYPTDQNVFWDVVGKAPNRELVVEWRNVPHYFYSDGDGSVTFQAVFSESVDDVVFNYDNVNFTGMWYQYSGAGLGTVGIQVDPATATTYASYGTFNPGQPLLTNQSSILWQTVGVDFLLGAPTPAQLTIPNGGSQSFTAQVSAIGPLNRNVQLACENLPAGASCSISPATVSPVEGTPQTITVTVSVASDTALPDFSFSLAATVADFAAAKTQDIAVHVTPNADFSLTSSVGSLSMASWETKSFPVNVHRQDGYGNAATFTCSVSPAGPTCLVSPSSATPPGNLTVTVAGNSAASSAGYQVTLQGSDGTLTHQLVLPLTITDYVVLPSPLNIDQPTASTTFLLFANNGYTGTINLACDVSALPGTPTCVTQPSQAIFPSTLGVPVVVTINGSGFTPGNYPVTLLTTPNSGGPTRRTDDTASILGLSIALQNAQKPTVTVGQSTTLDLLVSSTVPIPAGVDLSVFDCIYLVTCTVTPSHVDLTGGPVHATVTLDYPASDVGTASGDAELMIQASIASPAYSTLLNTTIHRQDFALIAPPQNLQSNVPEIDVTLGHQTSLGFTMQETGGLNVPVALECSQDLPAGMTCQFDRSTVNPGDVATLTISADATMELGVRYVDLIATATIGGQQIRHVVTAMVLIGEFALRMEPDTISLPVGGEGVYFVYSNNLWLDGLGALSCNSPGPGIVCEAGLYYPVSGSTAVTVRSTPGVTPIGSYPFTVTLTALGESESVHGTLNVQGNNAIVVTSPNGYELWSSGNRNITWKYYGDPGPTVRIELVKNGSVVQTIADQVPVGAGGMGYYTWAIPDSLPFSQYYKIRVTSDTLATATDDSDERVFIGRGVDFAVDTNMAGRAWFMGVDYLPVNYVWSVLGNIRLDLYKSGSFVQTIASTPISGVYDFLPWEWSVTAFGTPDGVTPGSDYSLLLVPVDDPTRAVMSPNFTISNTSITIVSPKLNDIYLPGDTIHVRWTWIGNPVSPGPDFTVTCCDSYQNYLLDRAAPLGAGGSGGLDWVLPADAQQSNSASITLQANVGRGAAISPNFWIGPAYTVTVTPATGGQVQSSADYRILCGAGSSNCSAIYLKDSTVTLRAVPNYGYLFTGWTGACSGTGDCVLKLESDVTAGAIFTQSGIAPNSQINLTGVDLSTKTINAGQSAQFSFSVTPGTQLQNDITFNCSGLPNYSSCRFSPSSVTIAAGKTTVTLSITTTGSTSARSQEPLPLSLAALFGGLWLLLGQLLIPSTRRRRTLLRTLGSIGVLALFLLSSCGGGGTGGGPPPTYSTPPGSYTITVSAASGSFTDSTTVVLIVH